MDNHAPAKNASSQWWNWLLIAAGAGGVLAPDLSSLDILLASHNLSWILNLIHISGGIILLAAGWTKLRTWLPTSKLWNRVLLAAGIANVVAPDFTGLATWMSGLHIGWLTHVAHGLGGLALFAANWGRIVGKIAERLPEKQRAET
jgi:hypothetical protein